MNFIRQVMGDPCTRYVLIVLFIIFVYYIWKVSTAETEPCGSKASGRMLSGSCFKRDRARASRR